MPPRKSFDDAVAGFAREIVTGDVSLRGKRDDWETVPVMFGVNFPEREIREEVAGLYKRHGAPILKLLENTVGGAVTWDMVRAWKHKFEPERK